MKKHGWSGWGRTSDHLITSAHELLHGLDYLITIADALGAGGYIWYSSSLYTFLFRGSARDCPQGVSPNSPGFHLDVSTKGCNISQSGALPN